MAEDRTPRRYTRWTRNADGSLTADILGMPRLVADPVHGEVNLMIGRVTGWTPDEARLIGVRLIEAAALADGERAIRQGPADTAERG